MADLRLRNTDLEEAIRSTRMEIILLTDEMKRLEDALDVKAAAIARVSEETTPFFPHVAATIHAVADQGARLGVLSNACGEYARAVCAANGDAGAALARWDCVFGADDVPAPKPAPDMLLHAMRETGATPARTIMIDDSASGCLAARNAGVRCFGYATMGQDDKLADVGAEHQLAVSVRSAGAVLGTPAEWAEETGEHELAARCSSH